jgi:predicted transcriptional regulator
MFEVSVFGHGIYTYTANSAVHAVRLTRQLLTRHTAVLVTSKNAPGGLIYTNDGAIHRNGR